MGKKLTGKSGNKKKIVKPSQNKSTVKGPPSSKNRDKKKIVKTISNKTTSLKKRILKKPGDQWQITFDAVTDAICLLDKNQRILQTNLAMQKMFGLSQKELQGNFCWEVVHGTKKPVPDCPVLRTSKSLKPETMELRVNEKVYKIGAYPVKGTKGDLTSIVHIISDITDQKNVENDLRGAESTLRTVFESASDGILVVSISEKKILAANETICKMLGYTKQELLEMNISDIHPQDSLDEIYAQFDNLFRRKTWLVPEVPVLQKNRSISFVDITASQIMFNGKESLIGIFRDVTSRKREQDILFEEHRQRNYILEVTKTHIDIIDPDFNLRYVDDSWQKIYGDPTGRKCYSYFMGRETPCEKCGIPKALESRQVIITEEVLPREDNRVIEVHTIPFQNKEGEWLLAEFNVDITQRKQSEAALKQRDVLFKKLSDNVPGLIYQFLRKPDGSYSAPFATDASRDLFGCTPGEIEENFSSITRAVLPEDLDKLIQSIEDSAKHLTIWQCEFRVQLPGKPVRWLFGNSTPEKLPDGSIIWHGFCTDITGKKLAAEKLKQSQDNYRRLFEDHSAVKLIIDPETGIIIDANHAASAFYGWTREKMRQMNISDINTLTPDEIQTEMNRAQRRKQIHFEFKHRLASGDIRDVEVYSSTVEIDGKQMLHSIVQDVTERKKMEHSLRLTQFTIDRASDSLLWLDDDANIIYANDAACSSLGFTKDELLKMKVFDVDPDFPAAGWDNYKEIMRQQKNMRFESRHRTKDGQMFPVEVSTNYFEHNGRFMVSAFDRDITERKRMEKTLRENEARYKRITENMSGFVSEMDAEGIFRYNSPSMRAILGYDPEELDNRNAFDFVHPEDHDRVLAKYMEGIQTETEKEVEQRYRRKDGTYIWLRSTGHPIYGPDGKNIGMIVNSIDITERKLAEEKLLAEEERFRIITEQSSDIIVLVNTQGEIVYENPAVEKILGYQFEDRKDRNAFDNVHPDDIKFYRELVECLLRGESPGVRKPEIRIRHADGSWRTFEITGNMLKQGDVIRMFIANLRDVTERKLAEESLKSANRQLENIIEFLPDATMISDKDNKIIAWNRAMEKMTGVSKEDMLGKDHHEITIPFYGERRMFLMDLLLTSDKELEEKYSDVKRIGNVIYAETFTPMLYHKRGAYVFAAAGPLYDDHGNIIGMIESIRDVTERKKAEEEVIRLNETLEHRVHERTAELEAFSYSVSHDLRAPLRTIDGFGQALLEDYRNHLDEKAADYIDRIRKASAVMGDLIDDMLTLSRITRSEMDIIKVNMSGIARSILDEYRNDAPDREVRFIVADALEDYADLRLMRIVLENLLANAWKFTKLKSPAEIEFGVIRQDDKTVYFVRDNGAGFDMDYAHKLFAPFQRLHSTDDFAGTGIGLAIVKRIIARLGGDVWAEGTPDMGATFYFTLH